MRALGLAVVVGTECALLPIAGEDPMLTDLALSIAGPYRRAGFELAERYSIGPADPATRASLQVERRRLQIETGKALIWLDAEGRRGEEPDFP